MHLWWALCPELAPCVRHHNCRSTPAGRAGPGVGAWEILVRDCPSGGLNRWLQHPSGIFVGVVVVSRLSSLEREQIGLGRAEGESMRSIARRLGR
ncbi:helix-turn-helix domain-containing protein, partial [Micromonospora sp. CPCC 205546]|uniref:helix-turn-helix domain-containing protein n=1 Tax=Micromonospora sp. CPCC 205546 TaxID=3122397 RepID=UPI003FA5B67F